MCSDFEIIFCTLYKCWYTMFVNVYWVWLKNRNVATFLLYRCLPNNPKIIESPLAASDVTIEPTKISIKLMQ